MDRLAGRASNFVQALEQGCAVIDQQVEEELTALRAMQARSGEPSGHAA